MSGSPRPCTLQARPGEVSCHFLLRVRLQSRVRACSQLITEPQWPEWGLGVSVLSFQHWAVSAVCASHGALGPDPGCRQLSQEGQSQAAQGGAFCHLCSGAAWSSRGSSDSARPEARLRYPDPGRGGCGKNRKNGRSQWLKVPLKGCPLVQGCWRDCGSFRL